METRRLAGSRVLRQTGFSQAVGREPQPDFAAQVAEELRLLLDSLSDESLRRVALLKMDGMTVAELAECLGTSKRTIQRKLKIIRLTWEESKD